MWVFLAAAAGMVGLVLLGAFPALLPSRTPLSLRVLLLALLFGFTLWINEFRADTRHGWHFLMLMPIWGGLLISLTKVIIEAIDLRRSRLKVGA